MRRILLTVLLAACSSTQETPDAGDAGADVDTRPPTPPEWDRAVTRPEDGQADADRASCKFTRGSLPGETLGKSTPIEKDLPIDTILVIIQENHSFDSYFSQLNKFGSRTDIEVAPPGATNPDKVTGGTKTIPFQHATHMCTKDVDHGWNGSHLQYNDGKNDGFVESNEDGTPLGAGERGMYYWDDTDLPFYYELANTFAIGDHYHCSLLGPTWPNRMYSYGATSFGKIENSFPELGTYTFPEKDATVLDMLEKRHVDWRVYTEGLPAAAVVYATSILERWNRPVVFHLPELMADIQNGTLPPVAYIDANNSNEGPEGNDEHPPGDVQVGQKWTSDLLKALFKSPQWKRMAIFFTYDEHGGYYDHVVPPKACPPGDAKPILGPSDTIAEFDRYGFRVPFMLISPYAKKGFVSHKVYDHSSIVRFIEARYKMPALTGRDANADIPTDMFDFTGAPFATPPTIPDPTINQTEFDYCKATYVK